MGYDEQEVLANVNSALYCYESLFGFSEGSRDPCLPDKMFDPDCDTTTWDRPITWDNMAITECCRNESGVLGWELLIQDQPTNSEFVCRYFTANVTFDIDGRPRTFNQFELKCDIKIALVTVFDTPAPIMFKGQMFLEDLANISVTFTPSNTNFGTFNEFGRGLPLISTTARFRLARDAQQVVNGVAVVAAAYKSTVYSNTSAILDIYSTTDLESTETMEAVFIEWDPTLGGLLGNTGGGANGCASGYVDSGGTCVVACSLTPFCSSHGSCVEIPTPGCICSSQGGFAWTGTTCSVPQCVANCNGNHGECRDDSTFPYCLCTADWSGSSCALPVCPENCNAPNGTCTANTGNPTCECVDGFSPPTCTPSCPACLHGGTCVSGTCNCPGIFFGSSCQFYSCPGYNATSETPNCNGRGACDSGTSYACDCNQDWAGDACQIPSCTDTLSGCNSPNGMCIASGNSAVCSCDENHSGTSCEILIIVAQCPECENGNCTPGNSFCNCPPNFSGNVCESFNCTPDATCSGHGSCTAANLTCVCETNWGGGECDIATCLDTLQGCNSPNGTCVASGGSSPSCSCNASHAGTFCEIEIVANQCPVCQSAGTCTEGNDFCNCTTNYYGTVCESYNCIPHSNCNGHGSCSASNLTCSCTSNWGGTGCASPTCTDTLSGCNSPNGTCIASGNSAICSCDANHSGSSCAVEIITAQCPTCQNGGNCTDGNSFCDCPPNFSGTVCESFNCIPAATCSDHGTCSAANLTCTCEADWGGASGACDVPTCLTTFEGCHSPNGTCVEMSGAPSCQCLDGFDGLTCLPSCPACLNGGNCVLGRCACPEPFFGTSCQFFSCPGYNLATGAKNCNEHGTCTAAAPSLCNCDAEYASTLDCSVRLCPANQCANGGVCSLPVSEALPLVCTCVDGWLGAKCDSERRCETDTCNNGTCSISGTDLTCSCSTGFSGSRCQTRSVTGDLEPWAFGLIIGGSVLLGVALVLLIVFLTRWRIAKRTSEANSFIKGRQMQEMRANPAHQ